MNGEKEYIVHSDHHCTVDRQDFPRDLVMLQPCHAKGRTGFRTFLPLQRISQQKDLVRTHGRKICHPFIRIAW
jgi:hypothetical protein